MQSKQKQSLAKTQEMIKKAVTKRYRQFQCQQLPYEIEDFCQDVWVKILKNHFETVNGNFLNTLASCTIVDAIRKELRRFSSKKLSFFQYREGDLAYTIEEKLDRKIVLNEILNFIVSKEYPLEQKIAFTLRFADCWSYKVMSKYLKRPEGTLSRWISVMRKDVLSKWKQPAKIE